MEAKIYSALGARAFAMMGRQTGEQTSFLVFSFAASTFPTIDRLIER
jgi:hypothetical protein